MSETCGAEQASQSRERSEQVRYRRFAKSDAAPATGGAARAESQGISP